MQQRAINHRNKIDPDFEEFELAHFVALERYSAATSRLEENWNTRERFLELIEQLDKTSSPGIPYMDVAPTIGDFLWPHGSLDQTRTDMLWYDVQKVMGGSFDHRFRVFIKDEPHSIKKAKLNKWRLIIASNLAVQMVWRMCFTEQNNQLNAQTYLIPSHHGMVTCYGGWKRFVKYCRRNNLTFSRDLSGWDVSAPGWVFDADLRLRTALIENVTDEWKRVTRILYDDAFGRAKLQLSCGLVFEQQFDGYMKSGLFNTITTNSTAMFMLHVVASKRAGLPIGNFIATGDDTLQEHISDSYVRSLTEMGVLVKGDIGRDLEFMGCHYETGVPEPMYFGKHLNTLVFKADNKEDIIESYCRYYANSKLFSFWEEVANILHVKIRERAAYQFWYNCACAKLLKY
nr:MAG: RNA-dependent RNA polymerase [Solemoviridae sp.]